MSELGRPSKYKPEYIERALEFVGEQGKSVTQFAFELRVSKSTVYLWAQEHQDFSDALTLAQEWSQAAWETKLEDMMLSREVNAPLVKLYFANRFKWTDKAPADEDEETKAQPLAITFEVRHAADSIEITNAKS